MTQTITVSTASGLIAALKAAKGGETILLAGGNYGKLTLIDYKTCELDFPSTVKIAAADAKNPPIVTGLDLRGATNIAFDGITFDYTYATGQPIWVKPFRIFDSSDISVTNSTFDGDLASGLGDGSDGFGAGFGLHVRSSQNIVVAGNEFSNFFRGLVVAGTDNVQVLNNELHSLRMDGMNFSSVQGVRIEGNYIHDFNRSENAGDHADMIQFWTNNTSRPSTDIIIRNNTLDIGAGDPSQSIFMRNDLVDRGLAGPEMFYQNVLIEGNVITNAHAHGITVGETAGLIIRNNTVLHSDGSNPDGADASVEIPRISVAQTSTDVTVIQNVTSRIAGDTGRSDWIVEKNVFVQDQDASRPDYYGNVFLASSLDLRDGRHEFIARPGSLIEQLGAGAELTRSDVVDAAFQITADEPGASKMTFDASVMAGDYPAGTTYLWTFGDGNTATGRIVEHSYATAGTFETSLTVTLPNGERSKATAEVEVHSPDLVTLGENGTFIVTQLGNEVVLQTTAPLDAEGGIQLGGTGVAARISRDYLEPIFTDKSMAISFSVDSETTQVRTGEIFRLNGSFIVSVDSTGSLLVRAWSSEGNSASLRSTGFSVYDKESHDVDVRLEDGRLSLWVDGKEYADAAFAGSFANTGSGSLAFGHPWGGTNFRGDLTAFEIDLDPVSMDDPFTGLIAVSDSPVL